MSDTTVTPTPMAGDTTQVEDTRTPLERIKDELTSSIRLEFENKFALWKEKEFADYKVEQDALVEKTVNNYLVKQEEARKPLEPEDIQKLLSQEYVSFTIELEVEDTKRKFKIRELPASAEETFYKDFANVLKEHGSKISAFDQSNMDMPFEQKLMAIVDSFGIAFDLLPTAVKLIIDPENKDKNLDNVWIKTHMSSHRMWNIINAQLEVNKVRDFFSQLFQSGTMATTMTSRASILRLPVQPVR